MTDIPVVSDELFPVAAKFINESDVVLSAIMVFEVLHSDGIDTTLITVNTEMPWWRVNGMLRGGEVNSDGV